MRTLTSIESSTNITTSITLNVTASDQSTTWIFTNNNIISMTPISYEAPFYGGFAKPSSFDITLSSSYEWIKEYKNILKQSNTSLTVQCNSDSFNPHDGQVRGVKRYGDDLNKLTLRIYDSFFASNYNFPTTTIADSYTSAHKEVTRKNICQAFYYGIVDRPHYHFPIDNTIDTLIGGVNVNSENHVSSVWFSNDITKSNSSNLEHLLLMNKTWNQQSDSNNLVTGGEGFKVRDNSFDDVRLWGYTGASKKFTVGTKPEITKIAAGFVEGTSNKISSIDGAGVTAFLNKKTNIDQLRTVTIQSSWDSGTLVGSASLTTSLIGETRAGALETVGGQTNFSSPPYNVSSEWSPLTDAGKNLFNSSIYANGYYINSFLLPSSTTNTTSFAQFSMKLTATLYPQEYRNYSIFSLPVSIGNPAITMNGINVIKDILDNHISINYNSTHLANAANYANSINFSCIFAEQQEFSNIIDEVGQLTAVNIWASDSGFLNFRGQNTNSVNSLDTTITTADIIDINLNENLLSLTQYSDIYSAVRLDYGYNFTNQVYENFDQRNKTNDSYCDSAYSLGLRKEKVIKTNLIMHSPSASIATDIQVKKYTQGSDIVKLTLPARFFTLELCDMIAVSHPIMVNSTENFQITKLAPDYLKGRVKCEAIKLID